MSKNYWEVKPEELNAEELKKYILDWYVNQVNTHVWGKWIDNEQIKSMRADVAQLNYALLLLDSNFPIADNLD